jgi:uncharacterized protein with von Willebrand factor type A (vWA) domain
MSEFDASTKLINVFTRLRRAGFGLGISELLDALRASEGEWGKDEASLLRMTRLLWCHSRESERELEDAWAAESAASPDVTSRIDVNPSQVATQDRKIEELREPLPAPLQKTEVAIPASDPQLTALPVQAPFTPALVEDTSELDEYLPVPRRSMAYLWKYLRRMVADGPRDSLDIPATVERVSRQGFFIAPVFRRRQLNHAHLVLLIDQEGSMVPFHRFSRDLVETARDESADRQSDKGIDEVEVYYFHDVVADSLYYDPHLTSPLDFKQALALCKPETSVLIVSDAGAARGLQQFPRIRATSKFLFRLRQHTALIAWLNPMPETRWAGTSAQVISQLAPMFQMNPDGLSKAIDVVRGQAFESRK